jgi:hypothetical protein
VASEDTKKSLDRFLKGYEIKAMINERRENERPSIRSYSRSKEMVFASSSDRCRHIWFDEKRPQTAPQRT